MNEEQAMAAVGRDDPVTEEGVGLLADAAQNLAVVVQLLAIDHMQGATVTQVQVEGWAVRLGAVVREALAALRPGGSGRILAQMNKELMFEEAMASREGGAA